MKQKLIILLVVSFVLMTITPVISLGNEDNSNPYGTKSIAFLNALNIATIKDDEAKNQITREEFAKIIYKLNGLSDDNEKYTGAQTFSDVPLDNEYAYYIYTLKQMKILSGFKDGSFRPKDKISLNEATTIIVRILGYGLKAEGLGGYPTGYYTIAQDINLFKFVNILSKDALTKEEVAIIISNALNTNIMQEKSFGSDGNVLAVNKNETLLSQNFSIYRLYGIVDGIDITSLRGDNTVPPNRISINNNILHCGNINSNKFLGYQVEAYYELKNDIKTLKFITNEIGKNNEITLLIEDINLVDNYQIQSSDELDNIKKYSYNMVAPIIYNGSSTTAPFNMNLIQNKYGTVKLLDNNNDQKYDVIFIDIYDNFVVGSKENTTSKIYDYYDNSKSIALDLKKDEPYVLLFNEKNEEISFSRIDEFSVVSISKTLNDAPQEFIRGYVSNKKVKGTLMSIMNKNGQYVLTIDKQEVPFTEACYNKLKSNLKINSYIEVGLDLFGHGAYVKYLEEKDPYSYLIKVVKSNSFEGKINAKLMDLDGNFNSFELTPNVKIDDVLYKNYNSKILEVLNKSAKAITNGISDDCHAQVIKYTLNSEGKINYIDTVLNKPDGTLGSSKNISGQNKIYLKKGDKLNYKVNARSLGGKIIVSKEASVFKVPALNSSSVDYFDENLYETASYKYFSDNNSYSVNAYFSNNTAASAELITVINDGKASYGSTETPLSYFDEITEVVDKNGEVVKKVYFYQGGVQRELYCKSNVSFTYKPTPDTDKTITINDLKRGDMFRYYEGANGHIEAFQLIYSVTEDKMITKFETDIYGALRLVSGFVYSNHQDGLNFKITDVLSDMESEDSMEVIPKMNFPIMIYDKNASNKNVLRLGSYEDLLGYENVGQDCSRIIIQQRYCEPKGIYIIK